MPLLPAFSHLFPEPRTDFLFSAAKFGDGSSAFSVTSCQRRVSLPPGGRQVKNPKMAWESLQVPVCSAEEAEAPPTAAHLWQCGRHLCFGQRKQEVKTENCRLSGLTRVAMLPKQFFFTVHDVGMMSLSCDTACIQTLWLCHCLSMQSSDWCTFAKGWG